MSADSGIHVGVVVPLPYSISRTMTTKDGGDTNRLMVGSRG